MAITIAVAAAGLNQFVQQFSPKIHQSLKQELEFEAMLPKVQADYAYTGQDVTLAGIIQPYQAAFTPNNSESFNGITSYLRPIKADLEFTALELEKFQAKWKANYFTPDPDDIRSNYAGYILGNHVLPQVAEELNSASWAGEYAAPTPGTAGAILESVDGFRLGIAAQITAGRLTPITTGALVAGTMVTQVRAFCDAIPEPYRYRAGTIFMSKTRAQQYSDAYKLAYSGNSAVISDQAVSGLRLRVDDYNKTIVGVTAMEGSNRIVCVFDNQESMIVGTRTGFPDMFQFRFQEFDRKLKIMAEIYRFYSFETCQHMFVNEQV